MKISKKLKKAYKESDKKSFTCYVVLRTLVLITLVRQVILGAWENVFVCVLSLILLLVPFFLENKFKITIPSTLEIIVLCFIFSAEILGEINSFYVKVPHFDTILHTINGFMCAGVGFALIDLLNENSKSFKLSPIFVSLVAFCFSVTVGVLWEIFEYSADKLLLFDMQKDRIVDKISTVELDETKSNKTIIINDIEETIIYGNNGKVLAKFNGYLDIGINDTMKDLLVNLIGATFFSIFGYLYILNRDKYKFVNNFIPTKKLQVIKDES